MKHQIDKPIENITKIDESELTPMERIQLAGGVAKPIVKPRTQANILLLEWCCFDALFFGMPSHESNTCSVVRLTEREDMTTDYGFRFAQSAVNNSGKDNMVLIWSAIPCTGGPPWQNINQFSRRRRKNSGPSKVFQDSLEENGFVC